jgi:hypothetical protein
MGRKSNAKKNRTNKTHSSITSHKREGKKLIPPFMQFDNLKKVSWINDRLPEYLWVALIVSLLDREEAIENLKWSSRFFFDLPESERPADISLTELANLDDRILDNFIIFLVDELGLKEILKPLVIFKDLPGLENWKKHLIVEDPDKEWEKIYQTVARCFDHQSQEATDCRWARTLFHVVTRRLQVPKEMAEQILHYPNVGDMRQVRPIIRSSEMMLNFNPDGSMPTYYWSESFWEQGMKETPCWFLDIGKRPISKFVFDSSKIKDLLDNLKEHSVSTKKTTGIDAKHDAVFGLSFYCLEILRELTQDGNSTSILSRMGLRTIAESYITLAYLCSRNDAELWQVYRVYGSGQAKLAFLKLDEMEDKPKYIEPETLRALAGEDQWEEFVEINLGNWENTNLRKMSESANVKDVYNSYYDWTSGFAHGQWAAVRNTVFETCGNPVHRLHRIPKLEKPQFNDVIEDTIELCNKVLDLVNKEYPDFTLRLT